MGKVLRRALVGTLPVAALMALGAGQAFAASGTCPSTVPAVVVPATVVPATVVPAEVGAGLTVDVNLGLGLGGLLGVVGGGTPAVVVPSTCGCDTSGSGTGSGTTGSGTGSSSGQ